MCAVFIDSYGLVFDKYRLVFINEFVYFVLICYGYYWGNFYVLVIDFLDDEWWWFYFLKMIVL